MIHVKYHFIPSTVCSFSIFRLSKQLQAATVLANLDNLAHSADAALVLGVVFGAVKGAFLI